MFGVMVNEGLLKPLTGGWILVANVEGDRREL